MAIKELMNVFPYTYPVDKATSFLAGQPLARTVGDTDGKVEKADRSTHGAYAFVGLSADDKATSGLVTFIEPDPVGSTYVDGDGNLVAFNNAWFVSAKRALADNAGYDETVTNVTNKTAGASGAQGPARGVAVYQGPGQFVTDQFALYKTADTSASTYADTAFSGGDTFSPGDALTYGTGARAGKLVKVVSTANNGKVVAKVDRYDANTGLLYISLLA